MSEDRIFIMSEKQLVDVDCNDCGNFIMKVLADDENGGAIVYCQECYERLETKVENKESLISEIKSLIEPED